MNPANLRIGIGHDTHRLVPGGPLVIGGISIEHNFHLEGHSDADVLLHAITDAILGAAAMGDIGEMFPNTDEQNRDRNSVEMLRIAVDKIRSRRFKVLNLDCIIFAQRPKFSKYKREIADSIAAALDLRQELVGVKAKTGEGIGEIGTEQCMMAQCVALLYQNEK